LQDINQSLAEYNQQIEALAQTERYQKPVQALTCYKGIKTIFALTMITEIGDIQRFPHPRQLVSWIGMDIRIKQRPFCKFGYPPTAFFYSPKVT
jgi:transposase